MIEQLPLLPSTWAEWDWTKSNGESTATQMEQGYNALLNQGLCSSFSRFIWNDLVDSVVAVLDTAGLTWDSTYCGASDCKISAALGSLTATMFNSVALNVHRFGFIAWKWAMAASTKGYVGRDAFHGYSTHKADADFLYGWYIVELTTKLNRVIQVLKEEADLGELGSIFKIEPIIDTDLFGAPAGILNYPGIVKSYAPVPLAKAGVIANIVQEYGESHAHSFLRANDPELLTTTYRSKSVLNVYAEGLRTGAMNYDVPIETISRTALTPLVFVGYMRYITQSRTEIMATVDISNVRDIAGTLVENSFNFGKLSRALSFPIIASGVGYSRVDGKAVLIESLPVMSTSHSLSFQSASPITLLPSSMMGRTNEYSVQYSTLHRIYPLYIQRSVKAYSKHLGKMNAAETATSTYVGKSLSDYVGGLVVKSVASMRRACSSSTRDNTSVHRLRPVYADSRVIANGYSTASLRDVPGLRVIANPMSVSVSDGIIQKGIPILSESHSAIKSHEGGHLCLPSVSRMSRNQVASSHGLCEMTEKWALKFEKAETSQTLSVGSLAVTSGIISTISRMGSYGYAVLENYAEEEESWYDPVQTGSNLYIRSVDSSYQDDEKAYIDLSVFYEPKQIDNNLYIRSIASVWTDGNAANIDTAFFLEPVQEDNNLYIR